MRNLIRNTFVASALTAAGMAVTAGGAFAQAAPATGTVGFQGTNGSTCTFSNPVAGVLERDPAVTNLLDTTTDATIDLTCTGNANISVSTPQDNGSTQNILDMPNSKGISRVDFVSGPYWADNTTDTAPRQGPEVPGPFADETLTVRINLYTEVGTPIPDGNYNYSVVVTATPQ